ncbi:hypothetical protein BaRGS_00015049 [Batillaria attramentaria]|uniref:Apple domain-containing protein n=1 Tax=Batillaria attramentaria TaxID=370345 RepID=A0ABD0L3M7_9CAEN
MDNVRLEDVLAMAKDLPNDTNFAMAVSDMMKTLDESQEQLKKPSLSSLRSEPVGGLHRMLAARGLTAIYGRQGKRPQTAGTGSVAGGKSGMLTTLAASFETLCPSFTYYKSFVAGSLCIPDDNCLGLACTVSFSHMLTKDSVDLRFRVSPENKQMLVTINGSKLVVADTVDKVIVPGLRIFQNYNVKLRIMAQWEGDDLHTSVTVLACSFESCLPEREVLSGARFPSLDPQSSWRRKREIEIPFSVTYESPDLVHHGNLPKALKSICERNPNLEPLLRPWRGIQGTITFAINSPAIEIGDLWEMGTTTEFSKSSECVDNQVNLGNSATTTTGFKFTLPYPAGWFILVLHLEMGGLSTIETNLHINLTNDMGIEKQDVTSNSFYLDGSVSVSIVVASIGLHLRGEFLKLSTITAHNGNWSTCPMGMKSRTYYEFQSVHLRLSVVVKVLFFIRFDILVVEFYTLRSSENGWEFEHHEKYINHPEIHFTAEDKESGLRLFYAVGDNPTGTNVVPWTEIQGGSLLVPAVLPCGIPLYFLVSATNCQGLEFTAMCSIPTYDCTVPDGRVDAGYRCTSHPSELSARVIFYDDSELVKRSLAHAVGYSPGVFGNEVVDWLPLNVTNSKPQPGVSGDLREFAPPRPGRLSRTPLKTLKTATADYCASECLKMTNCVVFTFNRYLFDCELLEVTEGPYARREPDGDFETYERLGKSYTADLRYVNLPLRHGTRYYVNADVENVLGFHSTLTSQGTMVDFTPPEPGPVGDATVDVFAADGCKVSVLQRCVEAVESRPNHRKIIDGPGGSTVLNGNRKGQEMLYTMENYHLSANWDGFKDEECGIHGYAWSVGTTVCGSDVASFRDPHASIHNPSDWTNVGLVKDLVLPNGQYYVTVQAVSDIIHGGDLVTTVCHATPIVVDTTPPKLDSVEDPLFDETFRYLVVYYSASDEVSGISGIEFGLGRTKYDVMVRPYVPFDILGEGHHTYIVNEEFETENGVPAWIRLKVVNNVGLSTAGSSASSIVFDNTPPVSGHVIDGAQYGQDVCCQKDSSQICAQWMDFYDPDSNIAFFQWGVGLTPGSDDVVPFHKLSTYDKQSCASVQLQHNVTYYSTVIATNTAVNDKSTNATSSGVLVDKTPPDVGILADGQNAQNDVDFTSETATVSASWSDFHDPESGMDSYTLAVYVDDELQRTFHGIDGEQHTDHSFSFQHGNRVHSQLLASNRAGGSVTVASDGMVVDLKPPELVRIGTVNQTKYQSRDDVLDFAWEFQDPESGIFEYRCTVLQRYQGRQSILNTTVISEPTSNAQELRLEGLPLTNGAMYSLKVVAMNGAKISKEEELDDDGVVELVQGEPLWVTWLPLDPQSEIGKTELCITTYGSLDCLSADQSLKTVYGSPFATTLNDTDLQVSRGEDEHLYVLYLVVYNGADIKSSVVQSKPFKLLRRNVPGVILDGREEEDIDFSDDKASIAITFSGFSSDGYGIVGYEWAIGTQPFSSDVMPYTSHGLVVDDEGNGIAQAHIMQFEGQSYYSTVRAKTGRIKFEEYIVSSSDGFMVDTTAPSVTFHIGTQDVSPNEVVYQTENDKLILGWHISDSSGINKTLITTNAFDTPPQFLEAPAESSGFDILPRASCGDTLLPVLVITDNAGNEVRSPLPPVTVDSTPPELRDLQCTEVISTADSVITCTWLAVEETHSALARIEIGLGNGPAVPNLLNFTSVPLYSRQWSEDAEDFIKTSAFTELFVIVRAVNSAGLHNETSVKIVNDATPPSLTSVSIVTSPRPGYHDEEQKCQTSQDYIELLLHDAKDKESGIKTVEIAIGSSKGRSDLKPFHEYPQANNMYALGHLGLHAGSVVFATVKITNNVGLYTIGTSEGVVISPEPRLEVLDGPGDTDVDGQTKLNLMQGRWRYSDPCPIVSAEWSVRELNGKIVTNFAAIPDNATEFYNDSLHLENLKTYVNYVRIVDALGRRFTAFSDGITVMIRQPQPAVVRDGLGLNDEDYQESTDRLSANWDMFGDPRSTLPSDHILRYEAAVGTDARFSTSRADIHSFKDVGLDTNITFYGLNLTAKTATYYVTVRGYSEAGSYIETSSDGIKVGYNMIITHYYAGVSSSRPEWDNGTYDCLQLFESFKKRFDVYERQSLTAEAVTVIKGLTLSHGKTYFVTVIAEDRIGHCSAAISDEILVDFTPPVPGTISAEGHDAGTVIFLHSDQTVVVNLDSMLDTESGVVRAEVALLVGTECPANDPDKLTEIRSVEAKNETRVAMRTLKLQADTLYYLRATVYNGAGLTTTTTSRPLILDMSPPLSGVVKLGTDWTTADKTKLNQTHTVKGLVALAPTSQECVTQLNLFSESWRDQWKSQEAGFAKECAAFDDDASLHVIVQHNPYLTGVDRGAARFSDVEWREGNYTFRLKPAASDNILTGVSLVSPELKAPFYPGNLSALPCDTSTSQCRKERNNSDSDETTLNSDTDYGVGFTFLGKNGTLKTIFWAQDQFKLKQTLINMNFDTESEADIVLNLKQEYTAIGKSWDISIVINGRTEGTISGLLFPNEVDLVIYTWNVDDFFPPVVDPLNPFKVVTRVSAVSVPMKERPLCSYGSPFYDDVSGVKEIWVGLADSDNSTDNVAPYRLVKSFCPPCLLGCQSICSSCHGESLSDDFQVVPLEVNGLVLEAANDFLPDASAVSNESISTFNGFDDVWQPSYHISVRVVDHGGHATESRSAVFIVDTSPPVTDVIRIVDPVYASDEPVTFVGNNHTVGVHWETSDDATNIAEVCLVVRSQPDSGNVSPKFCTDKNTGDYTFTDLSLADDKMYYVAVKVRNEAWLISHAWGNFTVRLTPPDMSAIKVTLPNVTMVTISGQELGLLDNTERLELNLDLNSAGDVDIEYFEWAIGTAEGKEDLFPKSRVGLNSTKKVAIVDGFMQLDGAPGGISIGDYTKKNMSSDTPPDPTANKFLMEPGRCLRQRVYGGNKAHVRTAIDVTPTCIKMSRGAMMAGVLQDSDLDAGYGTSASTEFSPFIVRPDPVLDQTSRVLRKRLSTMPGPSIFLSPVAEAEINGFVEMEYSVPSSIHVPKDSTVTLLVWQPEKKEWFSPEEMCPGSSQSYDSSSRVVTAQLCERVFDESNPHNTSSRSRRSAGAPTGSLGPRMVTVAVVSTAVVNTPPVLHNTSFTMLEDDGQVEFSIIYTDKEGDSVFFTVGQQPLHGTAFITRNGKLSYQPRPNFSGADIIHVTGREISSDPSVTPAVINFDITVTVSSLNDPPDIFYLPVANDSIVSQELVLGPTAGNGVNMSVFVEGNTTTYTELGIIAYSDVDPNDNISYVDASGVMTGSDFVISDISHGDPRLSAISSSGSSGIGGREIALNLTEGFSGHVVYETRVKDAAGTFSMQVTLGVYVLINPCSHGNCEPRVRPGTCQAPQRALTFDDYVCECDVGYEGQWCETDTNDCATATCSPIHDCVDLVGGYRCDYNPTKLAAIIVCSVVAVVLIVVAVFRLKKRNPKVGVWNYAESEWEVKPPSSPKTFRHATWDAEPSPETISDADWPERPGTSCTVSDVHCATGTPTSDGKTGSQDFAFLNSTFFAFNPSQNPLTARRPLASIGSDDVTDASPRAGQNVKHTKTPGSRTAKPAKPKAVPTKTTAKHGKKTATGTGAPSSFKELPDPTVSSDADEHGPDDVTVELREVPTASASGPKVVVTSVVEEGRLPRVEN